ESPGGEELADDGLAGRDRQRHQKLDRSCLALLRPEPHRDGRDEQQIKPRVILEEGDEVRLSAIEEISDEEGESAGERHEYHGQYVGKARAEVGGKLALGDDPDVTHGGARPPRS